MKWKEMTTVHKLMYILFLLCFLASIALMILSDNKIIGNTAVIEDLLIGAGWCFFGIAERKTGNSKGTMYFVISGGYFLLAIYRLLIIILHLE